jgi:predicted nucleic acid-binding Zn ribbon protein
LQKWLQVWGISTDHFDGGASVVTRGAKPARPLEEILVDGSGYSRANLKPRLYHAGLKSPHCELCGQDEIWRGRVMSLILDHVNGTRDDNRLENLRIVCPNCAATLVTHCGCKNHVDRPERHCLLCGVPFRPNTIRQQYCSRRCGTRHRGRSGKPNLSLRRITRPPHAQLLVEIADANWSAAGRKYGVSDNAIRKWVRQYEREIELSRSESASRPARAGPGRPSARPP